jgi:hypothetical protein
MTTVIDINQIIADLQTYADSLCFEDRGVNFAIVVDQDWASPVLIVAKSDEYVDFQSVIKDCLESKEIPYASVCSAGYDDEEVYEKALIFLDNYTNEEEEEEPKYKQITLDDVVYNLVPAE